MSHDQIVNLLLVLLLAASGFLCGWSHERAQESKRRLRAITWLKDLVNAPGPYTEHRSGFTEGGLAMFRRLEGKATPSHPQATEKDRP